MLEGIIELVSGLFLIGLILLIGACIMASILAALHGIRRGSATSTSSQKTF